MLRTSLIALMLAIPTIGYAQKTQTCIDSEQSSEVLTPNLDDAEMGISKGWKLGDWRLGLSVGVNGSLADNSKKVGAANGRGFNVGGRFGTYANMKSGNHEWRNNLSVVESFSKSPETEPWVKAMDEFSFATWYLYTFGGGNFGLFGNFSFTTNLVPTVDVAGETVNYVTVDDAGNPIGAPVVADRIELAPSFSPFFMRQSVGLQMRALKRKWMNAEFFAGFLVQEYFAKNIKTDIDYDEATNTIFLVNLDDFVNGGPSLAAGLRGVLFDDVLSYSIETSVMYSVFRRSDAALPGSEFAKNINFDMSANVALQLAKWVSINYGLGLQHFPEILDGFQVSHNVFLTFCNPFESDPS